MRRCRRVHLCGADDPMLVEGQAVLGSRDHQRVSVVRPLAGARARRGRAANPSALVRVCRGPLARRSV